MAICYGYEIARVVIIVIFGGEDTSFMGALDRRLTGGLAMGTALLFVLAAALVIAGGAPMSAGTVGSYLLLLAGVVAIASSIITLINGGNFVQNIRSGLFLLSGAIFVVSAVTGSSTIFAVAAVLAALAMVADTLSLWVGKLYGAMYISAILAAVELFFAIMAISQGTAFYQGFALIIVGAWVALSTIISSMLSGPQDGARNERGVSARKEASKVSAPKEVKAISPAEESASKPKDIVPKTEPKAVEEPKVTEESPKKVEEPVIAVAPTIEEPVVEPQVQDEVEPSSDESVEDEHATDEEVIEPVPEESKAEPEEIAEEIVVEEVESVVIDDEPVLEMVEDEPEEIVEVVEAESEISIEEADVSEPDIEAPEQVIEADWSSEEPEILDISGDGDRYQDEAVIEVIEDRPEEDAPSTPGPAPAVEEEEVLGEDLFTDYSPEAVVRRAAWNKGLRCRRDYGPYNIPVAFVKGKVAVFVVPADADTSMDAALIDEGWTILRYDEALVTDGKVQGEEIAATVKLKLREIKATTKGKKKSTKK